MSHQTTFSAPATSAKSMNGSSGSDHLARLGEDVYLIEGEVSTKHNASQPDVVVVFGWMDADIRHIRKYADQYRQLMPTSKLIIVKSHNYYFWSSPEDRRKRIQPIVEYLDSQGITLGTSISDGAEKTLHLHAFSNGGTLQVTEVGKLLRARGSQASQSKTARHTFPARTLVIDSAPGGNALKPLLSAFTAPIKSVYLKWLAYIPITFTWIGLILYYTITRKISSIDQLQKDLLDPTILPKNCQRLYIYSKTDSIILKDDVERNIAQARQAGITVSTEVYDKSPHVSHARTDGPRYWAAVLDLWKRALA